MDSEEHIKKGIQKFYSNVSTLQHVQEFSKEIIKLIINKRVKEEKSLGFDHEMEEIRVLNLISFLYFVIGKREEAVEYNDRALQRNSKSVNALACRAWYHLHWSEFYESQCRCAELEALKTNKLEIHIAQAEVAFTYSKLGIKMYQNSESVFNKVLEQEKLESLEIPEYYICAWKFGLALTIRRQLTIPNIPDLKGFDEKEIRNSRYTKVIKLLTDIISMKGVDVKHYRALAYVEIALLLSDESSTVDVNSLFPDEEQFKKFNPCFCFEKALQLQPTNVSVLEGSGKYFRLIGDFVKSIECLEKAIQINPTSIAHHHLALAIQSKRQNELDEGEKAILNVSKMVRKLPYFPADQTGDIIEHFDRAISLNNNTEALHDKGLLLRASGQNRKALATFKSMFHNQSCSMVQLVDAYEQAGLCCLELMQDGREDNVKVQLEHDAKIYLSKSIEISCNIVAKIPELERRWTSFATLKGLLQGKVQTESRLRELAQLHHMVEKYEEAIGFYNQVLAMSDDIKESADVLMSIIQSNIKLKRYDDAILNLDMIRCLPNGKERIDRNLYLDALIQGGINSWQKGEKEIARMRFKNALRFRNDDDTSCASTDLVTDADLRFDIFILSTSDTEERASRICQLLQSIGLIVTLNSQDVRPGFIEDDGMIKNIENSNYCAVFLSESDRKEDISRLKMFTSNMTRIPNMGNVLVISEKDKADIEPFFRGFLSVSCKQDLYDNRENITDAQFLWVKHFFWKLTCGCNFPHHVKE